MNINLLNIDDLLFIKVYLNFIILFYSEDHDVPGTQTGVSSLSVAAIIGIIIGCLVLVGLIILFFWCLCTGMFRDNNKRNVFVYTFVLYFLVDE